MSSTTITQTKKLPYYAATDPHELANRFIKCRGRDSHGHFSLRYWREEFWRFHEGRYRKLTYSELEANVGAFVREEFQRTKPTTKNGQILQVTRTLIGNVMLALKGILLVDSNLEQPTWLGSGHCDFFVFANGMVSADDLVRGSQTQQTAHCSKWFTQTAFPYNYDATATCTRWLGFLNQVLESDPERIALVQQWFGYCLTADTKQQRFIVAVGEGENGKSVMLDLLTAMLGPDNVSHVRAELFAQRFQLTMTLGKLANISYDTGEIDESAEATIKEFTGGDRMYFDRKGVPGINAYPSARLILATNHEPRFADRSKGIWRRMIVIPFRVSIPREQQDPQLASKLKAELPGIFNWAIEGLRDLNRAGQFKVPTVSKELWDELRSESNPAREFLSEFYEAVSGDLGIPCGEIYGQYENWCRERGFKPLDMTVFGKELKKMYPKAQRKRGTKGERQWRYCGVRAVISTPEPSATASGEA